MVEARGGAARHWPARAHFVFRPLTPHALSTGRPLTEPRGHYTTVQAEGGAVACSLIARQAEKQNACDREDSRGRGTHALVYTPPTHLLHAPGHAFYTHPPLHGAVLIEASQQVRVGTWSETELVTKVVETHQPLAGLHERTVHAVDLVVEATRVAQVVAGGIAPPQRRVVGAAVDALPPLLEHVQRAICCQTPVTCCARHEAALSEAYRLLTDAGATLPTF